MATSTDGVAVVGRFAPSPTGRMHAGNIYAALMSWLIVRAQGGSIVLRIEDLDVERSRKSFSDQVMRDFELLGLTWDVGPFYQQGRDDAYRAAFESLQEAGLVYPCFCTRADLKAASAPHRGEKAVYPGTCRSLSPKQVAKRMGERQPAWRLAVPFTMYAVDDLVQGRYGQELASECGDFVIRRSDGLFAYQLASVVDDGEQGVNFVVRGMDLLASTPQQAYLQDMLGLERCRYAHVPLLVAERDRRLSKRDRDAGLESLISTYRTPEGVLGHIAHVVGLQPKDEPATCTDLLARFQIGALGDMFPDKVQVQWRP